MTMGNLMLLALGWFLMGSMFGLFIGAYIGIRANTSDLRRTYEKAIRDLNAMKDDYKEMMRRRSNNDFH
jgi:hypothetical protein